MFIYFLFQTTAFFKNYRFSGTNMFNSLTALATFVAMVSCETGYNSDQDNGNWAYQWYIGEPFEMVCNTSSLNVQPMEWIVWETPNDELLNGTVDTDHYKVEDRNNVNNFVLTIKRVQPTFHGVYKCHVFDSSMATRDKTIFGLNIREAKHRDNSDRYNYNIKVAFIATAVFLAPVLTICLVQHFRYQTEEDKMRRKQKKEAVVNFAYSMDGGINGKDSGLPKSNGREVHENQGFDTPL